MQNYDNIASRIAIQQDSSALFECLGWIFERQRPLIPSPFELFGENTQREHWDVSDNKAKLGVGDSHRCGVEMFNWGCIQQKESVQKV